MIYAYVCDKCGTSFEVHATLDEKRRGLEPVCPRCESREVRQDYSDIDLLRRMNSTGPFGRGPGGKAGCC